MLIIVSHIASSHGSCFFFLVPISWGSGAPIVVVMPSNPCSFGNNGDRRGTRKCAGGRGRAGLMSLGRTRCRKTQIVHHSFQKEKQRKFFFLPSLVPNCLNQVCCDRGVSCPGLPGGLFDLSDWDGNCDRMGHNNKTHPGRRQSAGSYA
ncbi:hypothetical protein EDB81DRAFT_3907 [Dactylonectria macrodidyma]|uniref:Secreted protein n=1 Tax=Dactylonectria macrodidyma TaxID=307937 RepID=A0A9P9FSX0_9HYPO|nr:hypothetical protein EDB81DRAFT_3907 [Dactylonectria macrodidyma]